LDLKGLLHRPDFADAGCVEDHHGWCAHRSLVCSSRRNMYIVPSVLKHQTEGDLSEWQNAGSLKGIELYETP
jgi:hypothetical protein